MQKELRIMPTEDKPAVWFADHGFHMFTDDMRSGELGRGGGSELLLTLHSHYHRSAHLCNPRLRQKYLSVGYLIQMKER